MAPWPHEADHVAFTFLGPASDAPVRPSPPRWHGHELAALADILSDRSAQVLQWLAATCIPEDL